MIRYISKIGVSFFFPKQHRNTLIRLYCNAVYFRIYAAHCIRIVSNLAETYVPRTTQMLHLNPHNEGKKCIEVDVNNEQTSKRNFKNEFCADFQMNWMFFPFIWPRYCAVGDVSCRFRWGWATPRPFPRKHLSTNISDMSQVATHRFQFCFWLMKKKSQN